MKFVLQDEIESYGKFDHEKILIVDDNDTNLFVIKTILEDRGLIVDTALSGTEGIARYELSEEFEYKIIFLDINMYDLNGYDVSKQIRNTNRKDSKKIPIYALSANIFAKDRMKAKESGMNGYVTKPVDYKSLFSLIREVIDDKKNCLSRDNDKINEDKSTENLNIDEKSKDYVIDNLGQHFIFNALNTIKGAVITNSDNTCSLINDLSDYMQYRLKTLREINKVSLREEIKHLQSYSRLEMARFSYMDIKIEDVSECKDEFYIPAMSLVFLVENAVHHGLRGKKCDSSNKAQITVKTKITGPKAIVNIKDNGTGFNKEQTGFSQKFGGVNYIKQQIEKLCHGKFKIESKADEGTEVEILLYSWGDTDEDNCCG